jgi:tRNA uridine 5-carboxymethylaminomethyl modification enzyme
MLAMHPALNEVADHPSAQEQVILEAKYAGYIQRQATQVERFQQMEDRRIPSSFDFHAVPQLRVEAREKFSKIRPATLGQAGRISGINPTDLAVLMIYLD